MAEIEAVLGVAAEDAGPKKPVWAKCQNCGHCWPVAYLPMNLSAFAKLAKRTAICPHCATTGKKIIVAKQNDGELLEARSSPTVSSDAGGE